MSDGVLMNGAPDDEGLATVQSGMSLGLYGKHPTRGDFIDSGIAPDLLHRLEEWLDTILPMVKISLGGDWEPVWDQRAAERPVIAFWLGEEIWGLVVAGVMAPSRDKVGRRFPLVFLASGPAETALPAPVIDQSQEWYATLVHRLRQSLEGADFSTPDDLVAMLPLPAPDRTHAPAPADFWAIRQGADVATLLADIVQTDHRRALAGRSYWWRAGHLPQTDGGQILAIPASFVEKEAIMPLQAALAFEVDDVNNKAAVRQADAEPAAPNPAEDGFAEFPAWSDPSPPVDPPLADAPSTPSLGQTGPAPEPERPRLSQVYAGKGLPSADIVAWLLRGTS